MLEVLPLADGTSNFVMRITYRLPDASLGRLIARQSRKLERVRGSMSVAEYEHRVLALLFQRGFPVPRPLGVVSPDHDRPPILLTDFIEGTSSVAAPHLGAATAAAASFLARLHDQDLDDRDFDFLLRLPWPVAIPAAARNAPVLCHGDFWPGNMIWREHHLAAVFDFEDAGIGTPLLDLANTRFELWLQFGEQAADLFLARYIARRPDVNLEYLAAIEVWVAARARPLLSTWTDAADKRQAMEAVLSAFEDNARRRS